MTEPKSQQALFIPNEIIFARNQHHINDNGNSYFPMISGWKGHYGLSNIDNFKTATGYDMTSLCTPENRIKLELNQTIKNVDNDPYSGFTLIYGDGLTDAAQHFHCWQPHNNDFITIYDGRYNSYLVVPMTVLMIMIIKFHATINNNTFIGNYVYAFNEDYKCPIIVDLDSPVKDFITERKLCATQPAIAIIRSNNKYNK